MSVLIGQAELAVHPEYVVLDVRWALGDPDGRQHYENGHIPGAVFVDLETELAAPPSKDQGRHPLPKLDSLQESARRWGIDTGDHVVVYDAVGGTSAARAWWLLKWAGVDDVRILDGGFPVWIENGLPVETGTGAPRAAGNVTLTSGKLPTITIDEAEHWRGTLLDARASPRYRGEVEPVDPKAGHIPGAISAPTVSSLAPNGTFLAADELRQKFDGVQGPRCGLLWLGGDRVAHGRRACEHRHRGGALPGIVVAVVQRFGTPRGDRSSAMTRIDVRRADDRLHTKIDWLDSRHSFSFGHHYDPDNIHHGVLLVNNDDTVIAGQGFDTHPHSNMEIVTWVLRGSLVHQDSMGHSGSSTQGWPNG